MNKFFYFQTKLRQTVELVGTVFATFMRSAGSVVVLFPCYESKERKQENQVLPNKSFIHLN